MDNNRLHTEKELFERIAEGDPKAFAQAHTLYKTQLAYYARRFIEDWTEIEDVLSDVFLSLWNGRDKIRSNAHLRNFLFIAVRHKTINHLEAIKRHANMLEQMSDGLSDLNTIDPEEVQTEMLHFLNAAVKALPDDYRHIFELSYHRQLSPAEIARLLEINPSTVRTKKQRAIEMIKSWIQQRMPLMTLLISWLGAKIIFFKFF